MALFCLVKGERNTMSYILDRENIIAKSQSGDKPYLIQNLAAGNSHEILTDIYHDNINIAVWQRDLTKELSDAANSVLEENPKLNLTVCSKPQQTYSTIKSELGKTEHSHIISEDIALLVDMFCFLFDIDKAGIRLTALEKAMCPKFHVDRVPCRLVTTYQGATTQWLPNEVADRSKLSSHNNHGLIEKEQDICSLNEGDVSLLKGEFWQGNEGLGIIHRSPKVPAGKIRLFMSLDFMS